MGGWHYWLDGHEFDLAPGVGDGQGSLLCCSPWGHKESNTTEWLNWTEMNWKHFMFSSQVLRRRQWHPTPVLFPGKSHGWRSLVGCNPWGRECQTRLSDFVFTFHFHALEKKMATPSSVLAWRIPGMGEPGGLPSMGSQRIRHDWVTELNWTDKTRCRDLTFLNVEFQVSFLTLFFYSYQGAL